MSLVNVYCVPSRVWTVPSLCSWKFWKIQDNFDPDGQLIGPPAQSNPTASRGRNYLESFKIFMIIATELSTLPMGHNVGPVRATSFLVIHFVVYEWFFFSCWRTSFLRWMNNKRFQPQWSYGRMGERGDFISLSIMASARGANCARVFASRGDYTCNQDQPGPRPAKAGW